MGQRKVRSVPPSGGGSAGGGSTGGSPTCVAPLTGVQWEDHVPGLPGMSPLTRTFLLRSTATHSKPARGLGREQPEAPILARKDTLGDQGFCQVVVREQVLLQIRQRQEQGGFYDSVTHGPGRGRAWTELPCDEKAAGIIQRWLERAGVGRLGWGVGRLGMVSAPFVPWSPFALHVPSPGCFGYPQSQPSLLHASLWRLRVTGRCGWRGRHCGF